MIWTTLIALVPQLLGLTNKYFQAKTDIQIARTGATRDVAKAAVAAEAQQADGRAKVWGAIGGCKLLLYLVLMMAAPVVLYEWKIVVWDTLLGWGSTDPIKGDVAAWMNHLVYALFGGGSILAGAQLWWTTKG